MKTKKPRKKNDNLDGFIKGANADRHTGIPASQQNKPKKVTYYIKKLGLIKNLKQLGLDTDRDLSDLASEAIEDLINKYASKTV